MHELSLCYGLLKQVEQIANEQQARQVSAIYLQVGPLSGVEIKLLKQSFPIASQGTIAEGARLEIENLPVRIHCRNCEEESAVKNNQLCCPHCHSASIQLLSGDEMLLHSIKLNQEPYHV
ncbi:MAG: hydrogenase maturation nickel metallochaperone HypA [Gammaproteobacteria bacterium]|nr:hydrogenase maturation nickel metallochaperone HypA [Gammaproteobacteria bacterium]